MVGPVSTGPVTATPSASGRHPGSRDPAPNPPRQGGAAPAAPTEAAPALPPATRGMASLPLTRADALLQVADAAYAGIGLRASALVALARGALDPALTAIQRAVLNVLFQRIKRQIRGIGASARFDGLALLTGGPGGVLTIGVPSAGQNVSLAIPSALMEALAPRLGGAAIDSRAGAEAALSAARELTAGAAPVPPETVPDRRERSRRRGAPPCAPDAEPVGPESRLLIAEAAYGEIARVLATMAELADEAARPDSEMASAGLDALFQERLRRIADIVAHTVCGGTPLLSGEGGSAAIVPGLDRAAVATAGAARTAAATVAAAMEEVAARRAALTEQLRAAVRKAGPATPGGGGVALRRAAIDRQRAALAREAAGLAPPGDGGAPESARRAAERVAALTQEGPGWDGGAAADRLKALLKGIDGGDALPPGMWKSRVSD